MNEQQRRYGQVLHPCKMPGCKNTTIDDGYCPECAKRYIEYRTRMGDKF